MSDRGPVTFRSTPSGPVPERRAGSVTSLLDRAARALREEVCWLAPSTSDEDRRAVREGRFGVAELGLGYGFQPVPCRAADYRRYYEDAGVRGLWYALHDLWEDLPHDPGLAAVGPGVFRDGAALRSYQKVNRAVAAAAAARCHPRTLVCFQDYQFVTAPGFLRARLPTQPVGFFMHAAFAAPAALAVLPRVVRGLLLRGMLAADVLGFQSERWADSFLRLSEESGYEVDRPAGIVRHAGRRTLVRRYPAPPDQEYLSGVFGSRDADRWSATFRRLRQGVRLLVRVDRLDPAKNVLRGFEAFALLLAGHPELRERVRFVACLTPSRPGVPEYAWYAARVRDTVAGIQRAHPGVLTVYWDEDRVRAMAALREYDVLLVNSVHDGMNLVAQEGVLVNRRDGALILSARTGSAERLAAGALLIHDPRDVRETTAALRQALTMPPTERTTRTRRMRTPLLTTSPEAWLRSQLTDLAAVREGRER
ncbi:trehalose-6-phosphate synthase [Streptomyces sp. NPDC029674]|uniref:trehalose-6-phosphate synthase n=1 Tax=Streptomyces sp. NPDC029674 TaxID=3365297 RepID=UPI00384E6188